MKVEYLPLLEVQRGLYGLPRGRERFEAYLATMTDAESGDLALPLPAMNPMGKDHLPALLDEYLAQDADGAAARAVEALEGGLADEPGGSFRACLVLSDDAQGGWTNRFTAEYGNRFEIRALFRRGWLLGLLWSSEPADAERAAREALAAVWRGVWWERHGAPHTLGEMLAQEGWVMARAGWTEPALEPEDLAYTREVLAPHLDSTDRAVTIACLFGDRAAESLGYAPQGLSERAGLALALADARAAAG